jgi:DHA1 family tetracycline resistance protein-like MFS transporter
LKNKAAPILLLTFVNAIGGTLLIPVLPFVVRDLGRSDIVFALLIAAYPFAQFFAAPILGSLADHLGRRPVLIVSQAGTLVSWVFFAAAWFVGDGAALALIATSRIVDGLTGGNASVAAAYLADITTDAERTKVFSQQGAVAGVALIIGPALGSFSAAGSIGFLGPALLAMAISLITLIWLVRSLDESLAAENRTADLDLNPFHQLNLVSKMRHLTGRSVLLRLFSVQVLVTLAFGAYTTIIVLWYVDRLGVSQSNAGLLLLVTGVFLIFNELVTVPFVESKLGDVGTLMAGLSAMTLGFLLVGIPTSVLWFIPASFVLNVGMALVLPTLQSLVTKAADESQEGEVQGINTSVAAMASTAAPIAAGAFYAGPGGPTTLLIIAAFSAGSAVVFLASARVIGASIGEIPRQAQEHGPLYSLARVRGGGHRSFGLHLQGRSHEHHGIFKCEQDATK